ncbi:Periphilin-1 [Merluccius polli]|uniref:Periphilin-1 n=1 Tax=Merluccius polli TaxID=89951 RepID=A0AA47MBR7_MERPO|nr:Periphilin-1 [Merluccius polli]
MRAPPPHAVRSQGMYPAPRDPPREWRRPHSCRPSSAWIEVKTGRPTGGRQSPSHPFVSVPRYAAQTCPPAPLTAALDPALAAGATLRTGAKALPFTPQQGKAVDAPEGHAVDHLWGAHFPLHSGHDGLDKVPGLSRDVSPQSTPSVKEDVHPVEAEREEPVVAPIPPVEESHKTAADDFQERRAHAIAAKARDIEKVYRQDCETFGMVVKMLVAKDPNLEKQLQVPLRENLGEIRERCLEDLKHFISELDEAGRQSETLA